MRDALDDFGGGGHIEFAAGEIIEEKQWLGALHQNVVDAHADQVYSYSIVSVEFKSQFQLGADAVGAGDEHGFLVLFGDFHQAAETADAGEHFGAHGAFGIRLDVFDQLVAGIDIYPGITVGKPCGVVWRVQVGFSLSSGCKV